jgi:hypothetical protein
MFDQWVLEKFSLLSPYTYVGDIAELNRRATLQSFSGVGLIVFPRHTQRGLLGKEAPTR